MLSSDSVQLKSKVEQVLPIVRLFSCYIILCQTLLEVLWLRVTLRLLYRVTDGLKIHSRRIHYLEAFKRMDDKIAMGFAYLGLFSTVSLSAVGSVVGCARAGIAASGAMLETEGGHGKFLGVAALPSTQAILGIVLMFILQQKASADNGWSIFAIGFFAGIALLMSGIYQGNCCAMAINVSKSKPEIFGKSLAPAGIVEGFAVFVFIMALVLSQSLAAATK
jgi:V/A-type H+-transporting ATPase subunit K